MTKSKNKSNDADFEFSNLLTVDLSRTGKKAINGQQFAEIDPQKLPH